LGAIVRHDRTKVLASGEDDLCGAPTAAACTALDFAGPLAKAFGDAKKGLQELMTASDEDTDDFLTAVGLAGPFSCKELCVATLKYAQTPEGGAIALPPANAVVCEDAACKTKVPVDEAAVGELARQELEAPVVKANGLGGDTDELQEQETEDEPEPDPLTFTPQELTRSLLVLFDIYALPGDPPSDFLDGDAGSLVDVGVGAAGVKEVTRREKSLVQVGADGVNDPEFGPKIRRDRYRKYTTYAAKGAALLSYAIRRVDRSDQRPILDRWFGEDAPTREVKKMFQKQLKTILDLHIKKGDCSGSTLAYVMVWTNTRTKAFVRSDRDHKGQYVVHMCEHFWNVIRDYDYRYGTLIHEAAHHHGPTDVKLANGYTAYGRRNNLRLVAEQGAYGSGGRDQGTLNNADNYMTAVLVLASDQIHAPMPVEAGRKSWHAHADCDTQCGATEHLDMPLAEMQLGEGQCASCKWVTRKMLGGKACSSDGGYSLGKKQLFKKVCCYAKPCDKW